MSFTTCAKAPGTTRARALTSLGTLVLTGGAGVRVASAAGAPKTDTGDVKTLNGTLGLELAAIATYTALASAKLSSPPVLAVLGGFLADHTAHRDALVAALSAADQPATQTPAVLDAPLDLSALHTESDVLSFVYALERSLANAHLTALPVFKDRAYAQTAGSILGIETTHVALLAEALRKGQPYPAGFVTM